MVTGLRVTGMDAQAEMVRPIATSLTGRQLWNVFYSLECPSFAFADPKNARPGS